MSILVENTTYSVFDSAEKSTNNLKFPLPASTILTNLHGAIKTYSMH